MHLRRFLGPHLSHPVHVPAIPKPPLAVSGLQTFAHVVVPEPHTADGTCYLPCLSCYCSRSPKSGRVSLSRAETGSLDPSILAHQGICWIFMEWVKTEPQSSFCCPGHLLCGWQCVRQQLTGSWREKKYAHKTESTNCGWVFGELIGDGTSTQLQAFDRVSLVILPAVSFYRKGSGGSER